MQAHQPVLSQRVDISPIEPPQGETYPQINVQDQSMDMNEDNISIDMAPHEAIDPSPLLPRKRTRPSRFDDFDVSTAFIASAAGVHDAFVLNDDNRPLRYKDTKRGPDAHLWRREESAELRRLLVETGTMAFINPIEKPLDRTSSYYNPQVSCKYKDGRLVRRVRGVYGGNITDYEGDKSATTAGLQTFKLLINSTVSDDAKFMTLDIKDFYLKTILDRPEYMWIRRDQIPIDIQTCHSSTIVWVDDRAMVKITQGIYGLPQAGRLAQDKLIQTLGGSGYIQAANTPCLFRHVSNSITFTLVVDDFAVKYKSVDDVEHLITTLRKVYELTEDWKGSRYLGMSIAFRGSGDSRHASLSMPGYIDAALRRFPIKRARPTSAPAILDHKERGQTAAMAIIDVSNPITDQKTIKFIQEVVGVFLYYARAVDYTMITTINKLASRQANPTEDLLSAIYHFLQYASSNRSAEVIYYPSTMQLITHSDASYLSESKARSRAGGFFFLPRLGYSDDILAINGGVDVLCQIIPSVVASAAEAEYAALFLNGQNAIILSNTLNDMGHEQVCPTLVADNTTACGIANRTNKPKRSRAMDMRFHWIRDKIDNGDLKVIWRDGNSNLADYFTKTHPSHHYSTCRSTYAGPSAPETWSSIILSRSKSRKLIFHSPVAKLKGCIDKYNVKYNLPKLVKTIRNLDNSERFRNLVHA
jgi:hypothetical protein